MLGGLWWGLGGWFGCGDAARRAVGLVDRAVGSGVWRVCGQVVGLVQGDSIEREVPCSLNAGQTVRGPPAKIGRKLLRSSEPSSVVPTPSPGHVTRLGLHYGVLVSGLGPGVPRWRGANASPVGGRPP